MSTTSPTSAASAARLTPVDRLKKIADLASDVLVNPKVKASTYLRSGREMYRSAQNYLDDGSPENAYILYMRFLTIFVEKIHSHPGYKDIPPSDKQAVKSYCLEILPKAEKLKQQLLEKFRQEHELYLKRLKILQEQLEAEERIRKQRAEEERLRREQQQRDQGIFAPQPLDTHIVAGGGGGQKTPENQAYHFLPSAPSINQYDNPSPDYSPTTFAMGSEYSDLQIWKESNGLGPGNAAIPQFDRSSKPNRILSPICSGQLRPVLIPIDTSKKFLELAKENTLKNIETCGILSGKIIQEKLVITNIIVPKQTGSANECSMEQEEEIFTLQDKYNLITFGWIHTHPSQTAFLSSVDLHTQHVLQLMMPEAIAMVCAPIHNETGIYTISSAGMEIIGNCTTTSGFHTHPDSSIPIFFTASHATMDDERYIVVNDLRNIRIRNS